LLHTFSFDSNIEITQEKIFIDYEIKPEQAIVYERFCSLMEKFFWKYKKKLAHRRYLVNICFVIWLELLNQARICLNIRQKFILTVLRF
jgi:hypothetical protein